MGYSLIVMLVDSETGIFFALDGVWEELLRSRREFHINARLSTAGHYYISVLQSPAMACVSL
jgi:hypothetical protein